MKPVIVSIIVSVVLISGAIFFSRGGFADPPDVSVNNVRIIDGKQVIEIRAKGGYLPQKTIAKPGLSTVLRFTTSGTFDCSLAVRIPSLDVTKNLASSGVTDIEIGSRNPGVLQGSCGMGMYPFEIEFRD